DDMQGVTTLPRQALIGVVRRPYVVRGQLADRTRVGDRPGRGHLGPRADPHAVGLADAAVTRQGVQRRFAVRPHTLLEGAPEVRLTRLTAPRLALMDQRRGA